MFMVSGVTKTLKSIVCKKFNSEFENTFRLLYIKTTSLKEIK